MKTKLQLKGFSLVEVMIMFTMLSIIMAASMTMITRKSSPTPPKVSHGVYRCIWDASDNHNRLVEEQYSGTRRIRGPVVPEGGRCRFNVPQAAMYKVDIYSAGSGGNKSAHVHSEFPESERVRKFTLNGGYNGSDAEQLFKPSDEELREFFDGKFIVDSFYTLNAGYGGAADLTYLSPLDSSCLSEENNQRLKDRIQELKTKIDYIRKNHNKIVYGVHWYPNAQEAQARLKGSGLEDHEYYTQFSHGDYTQVPMGDAQYFEVRKNKINEYYDSYVIKEYKELLEEIDSLTEELNKAEAENDQYFIDYYQRIIADKQDKLNKLKNAYGIEEVPRKINPGELLNVVGVYNLTDSEHCPNCIQKLANSSYFKEQIDRKYISISGIDYGGNPVEAIDFFYKNLHADSINDTDEDICLRNNIFTPIGFNGCVGHINWDDVSDSEHTIADKDFNYAYYYHALARLVSVQDYSEIDKEQWWWVPMTGYNVMRLTYEIALALKELTGEGDVLEEFDEETIKDVAYQVGKEYYNNFAKKSDEGNWYAVGHINLNSHSGDEYGNSTRNLAHQAVGFYSYDSNYSVRNQIFGTLDNDGSESWSVGLRFRDLVDDILDRLADKLEEEELKPLENMLDVRYNQAFQSQHYRLAGNVKTPDGTRKETEEEFNARVNTISAYNNTFNRIPAYNKFSIMNTDVENQIIDYCRLEFEPFYTYANIPTDDTSLRGEIQFGKPRYIGKFGGEEGKGKLSRIIYQINYFGGETRARKTEKFETYLRNIKSTYKPMYCPKNEPSDECTFDKKGFKQPSNPDPKPFEFKSADVEKYKSQTDNNRQFIYIEPNNSNLNNHQFYVNVPDGRDLDKPYVDTPYPAWKVATGNTPVMILSQQAKGGKKPNVFVNVPSRNVNKNYSRNDSTKESWKNNPVSIPVSYSYADQKFQYVKSANAHVFEQSWGYTAGTEDSAKGEDAKFRSGSGIYPTANDPFFYRINSLNRTDTSTDNQVNSLDLTAGKKYPSKQEPQLVMKSKVWEKFYSLGAPGKVGRLESLTTSDLGSSCTFTIPKRGAMYKPTGDDEADADQLTQLQNSLATYMTCTNNEGQTVFNKKVDGPDSAYNTVLISDNDKVSNNKFVWNKTREQSGRWEVKLIGSKPETRWRPTSIWSRLFNDLMMPNGIYDIRSTYKVGDAGDGTTLIDKCLAPRGDYSNEMQYVMKAYSGKEQERTFSNEYFGVKSRPWNYLSTNISTAPSENVTATQIIDGFVVKVQHALGNKNGYNCYGFEDPGSNDTDPQDFDLYESSPEVQEHLYDLNATEGGGGAVVITW